MIDKTLSVKRDKLGETLGHIDANTMVQAERFLAVFPGITLLSTWHG
ncbi:hypothetical protein ACMHYO_17830 [Allopusillimonas ginsengisoli]